MLMRKLSRMLSMITILAFLLISTNANGCNYESHEKDYYCVICFGTGKFRMNTFPFVSQCSVCQGTGVSSNPRNNTNAPLYKCVYCNGSGMNQFTSSFCSFCRGYGVSYAKPKEQDRMSGGSRSNSNKSNSKQGLCPACNGRQTCPVCRISGGVDYGGIKYCKACGNTRRCPWCKGSGRK